MSFLQRKSVRSFSLAPGLLLGISLLFPGNLLGAETVVPQAESAVPQTVTVVPQAESGVPQTQKSDSFNSMEAPRDYLSARITRFASYLDRFFGGDRHYQESNQSVVQLDLTKLNGYATDHKLDLAARASLRLPATEGRFHLLLETDPEKNIITEPTPAVSSKYAVPGQVNVPPSVALAMRYAAAKEGIWHFNTDWGIKFPIPPKPFVRTRGSYSVPLGEWRLKAAQSVYWFNTLGAGETTQLDLERIISHPLLFRSSSIVTWLNDTQNFDLRQDLSLYHTYNDRTALLYQASAIGLSNPQYQMTDFVVLMLYRYRLHQQWLFFEVSPQLHFPRDKQYSLSPAFNLRLEVLFDDSR